MINKNQIKYKNVVLIGVFNKKNNKEYIKDAMEELKMLSHTLDINVFNIFIQKIEYPNSKTLLGSGKIQEIKNYLEKNKYIDTIIFDDELSNSQLKNISILLKKNIIDRTKLILDIFAIKAKTYFSKTQVELAQYEYILPRLKNMWNHLERQKGGIGLKGPGETEIETDRRIVKNRIFILKKKLILIDKQIKNQRKKRNDLVKLSLIGYTNAGKSTVMNILSNSDFYSENKLFTTLDTTIRKIKIKKLKFFISDTVGFIKKLPIQLIKSFKSTLYDVKNSDILLHIIDISNKNYENHIKSVELTLIEIGVIEKPIIMILNKIDLCSQDYIKKIIKKFKKISLDKKIQYIYISAKNMNNIKNLKNCIYNTGEKIYKKYYYYYYNKLLNNQ